MKLKRNKINYFFVKNQILVRPTEKNYAMIIHIDSQFASWTFIFIFPKENVKHLESFVVKI